MAKSEFTVGHMATGHLFGLAPLWEGEVSVYIPDISDGAQQESVWSGEPKGEALVLFYLVWLWLGALSSCHSQDVGAWRRSSPYRVGLGDICSCSAQVNTGAQRAKFHNQQLSPSRCWGLGTVPSSVCEVPVPVVLVCL